MFPQFSILIPDGHMSRFTSQLFLLIITFLTSFMLFAQDKKTQTQVIQDDSEMLSQYIQSKDYQHSIIFDASNIKQFWTNNTVYCKNGHIFISLSGKSQPLKIQLANVIETFDCKIDVISDTACSFEVANNKSKMLSKSSSEEDFLRYHIASATIHLDDTEDFSFNLFFSSDETDILAIDKIILSFSENKESHYLGSPGFDSLNKLIDSEGIAVPDTNIKYLILSDYKKVFIRIDSSLALSYPFIYHVYPKDKSNLISSGSTFNNHDFKMNNHPYLTVPTPYSSNKDITIIQRSLPSYESTIIMGQYDPAPPYKAQWTIQFDNLSEKK